MRSKLGWLMDITILFPNSFLFGGTAATVSGTLSVAFNDVRLWC